MPGLNHKGPEGHGPLTGRRMGRCTRFGANEKAMNAGLPETTEEQPAERHDPGRGKRNGFRCQNRHRRHC